MKIVVAVKQVAALDEEFELIDDDTRVDPDFLEWDLNEWDTFSLEAALLLREGVGGDGHEVVAVTVGDEDAQDGLLSCLAKGADRAVRVWDEALEGADALAVARVLAALIEQESPDLVLCGVQSSDAVNGATGVALSGFLGFRMWPWSSRLSSMGPSRPFSVSWRVAWLRWCGSACRPC